MGSALFGVPTLDEQLELLEPGDHVCAIHRGSSPARSVLIPFVRSRLARNAMCFYAIGESAVDDVAGELAQGGIDVAEARKKGALTLLENRDFMPLARLDSPTLIGLCRARAKQALDAGIRGMAFAVEISKEVATHDVLIEVEQRLNAEFFPNARAISICVYEREQLSADCLLAALRSHSLAIVDGNLIPNPFCESPQLGAHPSEVARADRMINRLGTWAHDREQLCRSYDRLHALIENAYDGIAVVDADGRLLYVAPSIERILGYKPEEMVGRSAGEFIAEEDVTVLSDSVRRAIENPEELQKLRLRGRRRDGTSIYVEGVGSRLPDPAVSEAVVFNFRDISRRVQFFNRLRHRIETANACLRQEMITASGGLRLLGSSAGLHRVLEQIEMVASTDATVIIFGETGVGKDLVAHAIHERSLRRDRPLVIINCTTIPHELFESEFFGHVKGAFSGALADRIGRFQLADGGTLFLNELGSLIPEMQPKLLRVLQDGEFEPVGGNKTRRVNVRIIAATNRDLKGMVRAGRFREDLYYRLSVFPIEVPPLRERRDDIPMLATHFLKTACKRFNRPGLQLTASQLRQLQNYDWPGNVRELQNVIERAVITARSGSLRLEIPGIGLSHASEESRSRTAADSHQEPEVISDGEMSRRARDNMVAALKRSGGRIYGSGGAAELLGIRPSTLSTRIKKLGLKRSR